MVSLSKLAFIACVPLLCFSAFAQCSEQKRINKDYDGSDNSHKVRCKGKCPLLATDYTSVPSVHIELKVDDQLPTDPIPGGAAAMAGFTDILGFDSPTTEAYWRAGLEYVKYRFGIDATGAAFDPVTGTTFLTVAPDGSSVQTPGPTASTNVVISPVTFTGSGTYRCVHSDSSSIVTTPGCRPAARLAEFILTFINDVTLSGTYGAEASVTGSILEPIPPGQTVGGGVAFGRYAIRGYDGKDKFFDMRSWVPSRRWPSGSDHFYYTERFQINPLDRGEFVGPGFGTLTIVYPSGPVQTPEGTVFPWYVRNDWWLGPCVSYPFLSDWDGQAGNTSLILPPTSFRRPCKPVH